MKRFILSLIVIMSLTFTSCSNDEQVKENTVSFQQKDGKDDLQLTTEIKDEVRQLVVLYAVEGTAVFSNTRILCVRSAGNGTGYAYIAHTNKGVTMVVKVSYHTSLAPSGSINDVIIDTVDLAAPLWGCNDLEGNSPIYYP